MGKAKSDEHDDRKSKDRSAADTNNKSGSADQKASGPDSSSELEAVPTKKGEPADNLRRRSEWFQKRTGGS
jgi:hypothetical protein